MGPTNPDRMIVVRETYLLLWGRGQGAGAHVVYVGGKMPGNGDKGGWFHPTAAGGEPKIAIVRENGYRVATRPHWITNDAEPVEIPLEQLERELFILAHEFGHFLSFKEGNRTADYEAAVIKFQQQREAGQALALPNDEKKLIYDEEAHAWLLGGRQMLSLDWPDAKAFYAQRDHDLAIYDEILGTKLGVP